MLPFSREDRLYRLFELVFEIEKSLLFVVLFGLDREGLLMKMLRSGILLDWEEEAMFYVGLGDTFGI